MRVRVSALPNFFHISFEIAKLQLEVTDSGNRSTE